MWHKHRRNVFLQLDSANVLRGASFERKVRTEFSNKSQEILAWRSDFKEWFSGQGEGNVYIQCDAGALSACLYEVLETMRSLDICCKHNYREIYLRNSECDGVNLGILMMPQDPQKIVDQMEFYVSNENVVSVADIVSNKTATANQFSQVSYPIQYEENGYVYLAKRGYIVCSYGTRMANVIALIRKMRRHGYSEVDIRQSSLRFYDLVAAKALSTIASTDTTITEDAEQGIPKNRSR